MNPGQKIEASKEKKEEYEVTILDRTFLSVFPRLREEHRQVLVTYTYEANPPWTVTLDLFEIFKEKQKDAEKEIRAKAGKLYEQYIQAEKEAIRKDIEQRLSFKPETIKV